MDNYTLPKRTIDYKKLLTEELGSRPVSIVVIESLITTFNLISALLGNCLVCIAVYRKQRLCTLTNYYLISLALSDILMSLLVFPITQVIFILGRKPFEDTSPVCKFEGVVATFLGGVSINTIALAAINRYFRVVRPHFYRRHFTKRSVILSILAVWILAMYLPLTVHFADIGFSFHPGKLLCLYDIDRRNINIQMILVFTFSFGIQYIAICFSYFRIYIKLSTHNAIFAASEASQANATLHVKEVKVTKMLFVTVLGFMFCWFPLVVIDALEFFHGQYQYPRQAYLLYLYMSGYSSSVNPCIYGAMNSEFRKAFKEILKL